jgi:hypothetical protein
LEARTKYINLVSKNKAIVNELARKTEGFSIDELKECVLSISCLGYSIDETVTRVRETTDLTSKLKRNADEKDTEMRFDEFLVLDDEFDPPEKAEQPSMGLGFFK